MLEIDNTPVITQKLQNKVSNLRKFFKDKNISFKNLKIANNQSIRDFVATIAHEMVHINQYITGEWEGDGEKEAEDNQYVIADKVWQEGIV